MNMKFFSPAIRPDNESARQAAVDGLKVHSGPMLQRIVEHAAKYMDCPVALVTLIDRDRQKVVASTGTELASTSRAVSFCAHTIVAPEGVMCVENAAECDRFEGNPLVTGEPNVRFYLGASLIARGGHRVGAVCVIDSKSHGVATSEQRRVLQELAGEAIYYLQG